MKRAISRGTLRLMRWRVEGEAPDIPKFVAIGAPHTSNWDFPIGLLTARVLRIRISWVGKASLFRWPFGGLMRWLGGIPSRRTGSEGLVGAIAAQFDEADRLVLAIAPEGTRGRAPHWRSGFYRIAVTAGVPILPVALDGEARVVRVGDPIALTGDATTDMDRIRAFYEGIEGIRPEGGGPVRLEDEG